MMLLKAKSPIEGVSKEKVMKRSYWMELSPSLLVAAGILLSSFIAQYYLDKPMPRELIVSEHPDECELLVTMLSTQSGHAIEDE